jgi:hypothetical protein
VIQGGEYVHNSVAHLSNMSTLHPIGYSNYWVLTGFSISYINDLTTVPYIEDDSMA